MYAPTATIAPTLAPTSARLRRIPRRTSGWRTRDSMTTKVASSAATAPKAPIVRGANHPTAGASTML